MHPTLPTAPSLPVAHLAAGFGDVTNSYKFYWLLAILAELPAAPDRVLAIDQLLARMVATAWAPLHLFRLAFGKQDQLAALTHALRAADDLAPAAATAQIMASAQRHLAADAALGKMMHQLAVYVPYRFLRPFFAAELRGGADWQVNSRIQALAATAFSRGDAPCLYRFVERDGRRAIELHPAWTAYLGQNLAIVTGFCQWHLTTYLQRANPNVPNIAGKLAVPGQRDLQTARHFWRVAQAAGARRCIYTAAPLPPAASLDHFLPWRFVAHDLLWNLTPTSRQVNSAKRDQLPDFARYFEPFAALQYAAVQAVAAHGKAALLEDYVLLFKCGSLDDLRGLPYPAFRRGLEEALAPQFQIARSLGFVDGWSYTPS